MWEGVVFKLTHRRFFDFDSKIHNMPKSILIHASRERIFSTVDTAMEENSV